MNRWARLLAAAALATSLHAQQKDQEQYPSNQVQSGQTYTFYDRAGSGTITLEYAISGASAVSISVQGCSVGGTCVTLTPVTGTNPYTGTSSTQVQFLGGYANYKVTPTFTGGSIGLYKVGIQAKLGVGGGGGGGAPTGPAGGDLSGTYPNPTVNSAAGLSSGASSATLNADNALVQPDSGVTSMAFGYAAFGDSITAAAGATTTPNGYAYRIAADYNLLTGTIGTTYNDPRLFNYGVAGDTAADLTFRMFGTAALNPGQSSNPITTIAIGTNNISAGAAGVVPYQQYHFAASAWASMSSTNKILAGNAAVTKGGTWTADTTFTNANGQTTSTAASTLSYTGQVGTSGAFDVWVKVAKLATTSYTLTIDGVPATDTITNSTTITNTGSGFGNATVGVSAARFVTTGNTAHNIVLTYGSGTLTVLGFGFPPTHRNRGMNAPRPVIGGLPPQQGNANAANVLLYNAANLAVSKLLVADGQNAPFADIYSNLDYNLDMASTATQNCPASTQPGVHPNDCGHRHEANIFESVIGAPFPAANSKFNAVLDTSNIALTSTLPATNPETRFPTSAGSTFLPYPCITTFSNYCWGITALNGPQQFTTFLMASAGSGKVAVSFPVINATPAQVASGVVASWLSDGSALLGKNATITNTGKFSTALSAAPTDINGYSTNAGFAASTTALNGGLNVGVATNIGIHQFYSTKLGKYAVAAYFTNNQVFCWTPYNDASVPTALSGFSDCPAYVNPDGSHVGLSFTATKGELVITSATTVFDPTYQLETVNLASAATYSFTIAAAADSSQHCFQFVQPASGTAATVTAPANVLNFFTVGTTLGKGSTQCFAYSPSRTAYVATSQGNINQ